MHTSNKEGQGEVTTSPVSAIVRALAHMLIWVAEVGALVWALSNPLERQWEAAEPWMLHCLECEYLVE